jgi:hemerythrin superfamily protein
MPNRMDSLISQGMGKVKNLKARIEGLAGIFRTLAEEHGEVAALLQRVRGHAEKREELWPKIRLELVSHERAEVRELYPVLREHAATKLLAEHHDQEARELEMLIATLDVTDIHSATWGEVFDRLVNTVIHHANEEEETIFPAAQKAIGEARAKELEASFLRTKKKIADAV